MSDGSGSETTAAVRATSEGDGLTRYRSIVQSALDAIITINVDNRITEFNPAAEAIFGHRRQDVLGFDLADLIIPPEMRLAHRDGVQRHRDSSTAPRIGRRIELEALRADGSRFPVELTVTRESGPDSAQFTAFIRDLSQQKIAEARALQLADELKASERLLSGVLSNLPGMAFQCALEEDPAFCFVSDGSVQLCGHGPDEFLSRKLRWSSLVHADDLANLSAARKRASKTASHYEVTYRIRAGTREKWVMEQGTLTNDNAGDLIDGLVVDVTSETNARQQIASLNAQLEARVRQRTAELELANAELETFSYSIAHDLRAPLTSIAGFSRIIEEKVGHRPELNHFFSRIRSAIRHMDDLIDAILSLARIKQSAPSTDIVDLAGQAREIMERLVQGEPARKVDLHIPANIHVLGNALLLRQVMENLIGNAWKFSGKAQTTQIKISCTCAEPGQCVVSVEDQGVGFDAAYANRLFKPFVRLHPHNEFEGTGIGLAVVHRIVTHHGGRIWAAAGPGAGACFSFTLPAPVASHPPVQRDSQQQG